MFSFYYCYVIVIVIVLLLFQAQRGLPHRGGVQQHRGFEAENISEESQKPLGVRQNGWPPHGRPLLVLPLLDHCLELFQRLIKP
jgi:hypothetical protein